MMAVLGDERMYEFTGGTPPTLDELRARYRRLTVGRSSEGTELWFNWIVRLREDAAPIGVIQATVSADGRAAEIAWEVGVPWQGHGIASEATIAVVDVLIGQGVATVDAHVHPDHHASAGVAENAGLAPTPDIVDGERVWRRSAG